MGLGGPLSFFFEAVPLHSQLQLRTNEQRGVFVTFYI